MRIIALLMFATLSIMPLQAAASEFGTKDEAVAMVKRAQVMFKKDGAEATFKAVDDPSNKEFHDRDLTCTSTISRVFASRTEPDRRSSIKISSILRIRTEITSSAATS